MMDRKKGYIKESLYSLQLKMNSQSLTNRSFPKELEDNLFRELKKAKSFLNTADLQTFRKQVRAGYVPNYDQEWAAFSYLYFGANYLKTFWALKHLVTPKNSNVLRLLDLGCGAGASTAGAVTALQSWTSGSERRLEITAVDRNSIQLKLYGKLLRNWLRSKGNITVKTYFSDALKFLGSTTCQWDAILCSYIAEEQLPEDRVALLAKLKSMAKSGSQIILIGSCPIEGRCLVEYFGEDYYSSFPLRLEKPQIDLRRLSQLNQDVKPMYVSES